MNTWKVATIGLALTGFTAMTTGLTTAYLLRAPEDVAPIQPQVQAAVYRPQAVTPGRVAAPARVAPRAVPVSTAAEGCETGGDRAWRIAKPGLVGTLVGAGLGAAGGAIADGGKGAGKGAVLGGIAGAAVGTGYGAYKTKNECGTIFGGSAVAASPMLARAGSPVTAHAADRIAVYSAR